MEGGNFLYMRRQLTIILAVSLLLSGCGTQNSPLETKIEAEFQLAQNELKQGKLTDAENRLNASLNNLSAADKNLLWKLKILNLLYDVEVASKNDTKMSKILKEASSYGEQLAETACPSDGKEQKAIYAEAKIPVIHLADQMCGEGYYQSARRLYKRAIQLETACGTEAKDDSSIAVKLKNLNKREESEENVLVDPNKLNWQIKNKNMQARRAAKSKLMNEIKALHLKNEAAPDSKNAEKMHTLLAEVEKTFGKRENEYRGALSTTARAYASIRNYEGAIVLLQDDVKFFSNITETGFKKADPTTIENAKFVFLDSQQLAYYQNLNGDLESSTASAKRAIDLAKELKDNSSEELAQSLHFYCIGLENLQRKKEALPYRKRQLNMLAQLNQKNSAHYYFALGELASDQFASGDINEALKNFEIAANYFRNVRTEPMNLANVLNSYSHVLYNLKRHNDALKIAKESIAISEKSGDPAETALAYNLAALAAYELADWANAEKYRNAQIQIYETGKTKMNAVEYSGALTALGEVYYVQKKAKETRATLKKAFEKLTLQPKRNFCLEAANSNILAALELNSGNQKEAERLRLNAYNALKHDQKAHFESWLSTLTQLALFYREQKRYDESNKYLKEAITLTKTGNSAEMLHRNCHARAIYAQNLVAQKKINDAITIKDEIVKLHPDLKSADESGTIALGIAISDLCRDLNDFPQAERSLKIARELASKNPKVKQFFQNVLNQKETTLESAMTRHN